MNDVAIAVAIAGAMIAITIALRSRWKSGGGELGLLHQQMDGLRDQVQKSLTDTQGLVQKQVGALTEQVQISLQASNKAVMDGFTNTSTAVKDVSTRLAQIEESSKRIFDLAKSMSELQDILKPPKMRGGLGELLLEDLLKQILPAAHYEMQYYFSSGEPVDAIIKLGDNIVPVDAKFPLENFRRIMETKNEAEQLKHKKQFARDLKKHTNDIADKYIRPDEGTYDFAIMYIPAENVYYETIIKDDNIADDKSILAHSLSRKVIPVSPNSFYAYLQAILQGLKGMHIEKSAQQVLASLNTLKGELAKFQTDFDKIGTHLSHADGAYGAANKRLEKFSAKLEIAETPVLPPVGEMPS